MLINKELFKTLNILYIENENELRELWCRLNTNTNKIKELNYEYEQSDFISENNLDFFNFFNLFSLWLFDYCFSYFFLAPIF